MARVVVLHSGQRLTVNPLDLCDDVIVVTDKPAGPVLREDVAGALPEILRVPRAQWKSVVLRHAGGPGAEVVTNDEYCLMSCRQLRAEAGLPDRFPQELPGYLDKALMKRRLRAAGIATPRFLVPQRLSASDGTVEAVLREVSLPAVAKPRQQANSRGIEVLASRAELLDWLRRREGEEGWHLEEFVEGEQYHVNAVVRDGRIAPVLVGRYLGPLLDLPRGRRLGGTSVPVEDPVVAEAHALNASAVAALGGEGDFVVHTEFMRTPAGRLVVLEVAARAPGAMVSEVARLHAGVPLDRANLLLQLGRPVRPAQPTGRHVGWVLVPVMPGERLRRAPAFESSHTLHMRRRGQLGNRGAAGDIGASVLLWGYEPEPVARDIALACSSTWDAQRLDPV